MRSFAAILSEIAEQVVHCVLIVIFWLPMQWPWLPVRSGFVEGGFGGLSLHAVAQSLYTAIISGAVEQASSQAADFCKVQFRVASTPGMSTFELLI